MNDAYWRDQVENIAARGQRVLALGTKSVKPEHTVLEYRDLEGSLTFLGIVGLIDPPRQEAIEAIVECHRAGIRVKMITGDHAITALAIAGQIGLQNPTRILTGNDLDSSMMRVSARKCWRSMYSHVPVRSTNCDWSRRCSPMA